MTTQLKRLTITNGLALTGAGIGNDGGTVTLVASHVTGNTAVRPRGGGIYNVGGVVTLKLSRVSGNTAPFGSGIFCGAGAVSLTRTAVAFNQPNNCVGFTALGCF